MGMISILKFDHKYFLIQNALDIFDSEGGIDCASQRRTRQKRGKKLIAYVCKPYSLNFMNMLKTLWELNDGNYVTT